MTDLRTFLDFLNRYHPEEIVYINEAVDSEYEITSYWQELEKQGSLAIFFRKVKGYKFPVVTNLFGSRRRIALAIGTTEKELYTALNSRIAYPIEPILVSTGPVKDVIEKGNELDVTKFPILKHFQQDAGRYVSSGVVAADDPDTHVLNLSYSRMQVKGRNKFGLSLHSRGNLWRYHQRAKEKGIPLPVAIFIGAHPAYYFAAGTRKVDEYKIVGSIMQRPVELVECESVDLKVPASAEIVIEGEILTDVEEDEGPFSEYTGYVTGRSTRNVLHVKAVTYRKDAIFQSIVPTNSAEHVMLGGVFKEADYFATMKRYIPTLRSVNWPTWGCHFVAIISVQNLPEGISDQAAKLLMGLDYYLKLVIVVDDDIDVFNEQEVFWAVATRFQPYDDVQVFQRSMGSLLDPSSPEKGITSKMIIDATKPSNFAERPMIPEDVAIRVREKLQSTLKTWKRST